MFSRWCCLAIDGLRVRIRVVWTTGGGSVGGGAMARGKVGFVDENVFRISEKIRKNNI